MAKNVYIFITKIDENLIQFGSAQSQLQTCLVGIIWPIFFIYFFFFVLYCVLYI